MAEAKQERDMDEYRLTLKVRNNLLMSAIERAGYKSQIEFAKREGISAPLLYKLVNMKQSPVRSDGTIRKGAKLPAGGYILR